MQCFALRGMILPCTNPPSFRSLRCSGTVAFAPSQFIVNVSKTLRTKSRQILHYRHPSCMSQRFFKRRQHHLVCFNAMFLQNMQPITVKPTHVYAPALGGFSCDTIKSRQFLFWISASPPIYSKCKNKRIKKHSGHLLRTFSLQDKIPKSKAQ